MVSNTFNAAGNPAEIRHFERPEAVSQIQEAIGADVDGMWGPGTNEAFTKWLREQQAEHMGPENADGWLGPNTIAGLEGKIDPDTHAALKSLYENGDYQDLHSRSESHNTDVSEFVKENPPVISQEEIPTEPEPETTPVEPAPESAEPGPQTGGAHPWNRGFVPESERQAEPEQEAPEADSGTQVGGAHPWNTGFVPESAGQTEPVQAEPAQDTPQTEPEVTQVEAEPESTEPDPQVGGPHPYAAREVTNPPAEPAGTQVAQPEETQGEPAQETPEAQPEVASEPEVTPVTQTAPEAQSPSDDPFNQADSKYVTDADGVAPSNEDLADRLPQISATDTTLFGLTAARDIFSDGHINPDNYNRVSEISEQMGIQRGHEFDLSDPEEYQQALVGVSAYSHDISVQEAENLYGNKLGEYAGVPQQKPEAGPDTDPVTTPEGQKPPEQDGAQPLTM